MYMEVVETARVPGTERIHSEDFDRKLVQRIAGGDRAALQQLFERHSPRVAGLFNNLALEQEVVDALAVETFVTVWDSAGNFDGSLPVSAWLLALGCRRALPSIEARRDHADLASGSLGDAGSQVRLEELGEDDWLRALSCLPITQRVALELTYRLRHSCGDIAAIMGCSEANVRRHVLSARQELHSLLTIEARKRTLSG
jgi:RNA polymerase sigma-70 factor (ECF subfamily)